MTTVYLIRHGEVVYPKDNLGRKLVYGPETHLSQDGINQIQELGEDLLIRKVRPDIIFTSPYPRTTESAQLIAKALGTTDIRIVDELKDLHVPGYVGTSYDDLIAKGGNSYAYPLTPDQETIEQLTSRIGKAFRKIVEENQGKAMAIVGHGDSTRALIHDLMHPEGSLIDPAIMRNDLYLDKGRAFKLVLDPALKIIELESVATKGGSPERKF